MSGMTELARAIVGSGYAPRSSEHLATVLRRDSQGVYWVRIPGGAEETPITTPMVEAADGDTVRVSISGGRSVMTGNVTSPASTTRTVTKVGGIANRALTTAYTESARIDRLETTTLTADSAVITDIQADTAKVHDLTANDLLAATGYIGTLASNNVTANNLVADHGAIGDLSANYAQINAANIGTATIRDAWVDKLLVQTGLLANDGTVFTLDAVQVNAANITAGTLDVRRLIVTRTVDGVDEKFLVDIDPTTSQTSYVKLDGDVLGDNTVSADKIVAHSITASEITTQNLVGTSGWINLASGTFSYGNQSTGDGISWDGTDLSIKGVVHVGSTTKQLSDMLTADDVTVSQNQTQTGYDVDIAGNTFSLVNGAQGAKGDKGDKGETGATGPQGPQGETGAQGVSVTNVTSTNNTSDGGTSVVTVTLSDGTTKTFNVKNGSKGSTGDTGATAQWYYGMALTHTSGTATLATSSTSGVVVGSMYLNTATSLCYKCTAISGTTATWTYAGDLTDGVIDNIEVGGRNLIQGTSDTWTEVSLTASQWFLEVHTDYQLEIGQQYTFSIIVEKVSSDNVAINLHLGNGVQGQYTHDIGAWRQNAIPFGEVVSITHTVTESDLAKTSSDTTIAPYLSFRLRNEKNATTIRYKCVKLEHGNVATDWTPAPEDMASASDSVEYIVGTQTAATGSWTGVTKDSALYTGKTIAYKLPYAGSGNASLQLKDASGNNVGGNIAVFSMTTRVTTHYPAGSVIQMSYDGSNWRTSGWYNTDTQNRTRWQNVILAAGAITSGHIICGTASGYKDIAAGVTFDLSFPLLYCATTKAAGGTSDNNFLQINSINVTNNGTVTSAANYKTVYLVGMVSGNTFTVNASPFMTTVEPTSEDGFLYIPLGMFYNSTTNIYFNSSKDLYAYLDGAFRQVDSSTVIATQRIYIQAESATSAITVPTEWVTNLGESVNGSTTEWTAKYPTYNSSFPVTFAAEQRLRLDKTAVCSDPVKDDVTTVIDGDHIVTGTIDATKVNVVNLDAGSITAGTLSADRISGGAITLGQLASDARNAIANAATTATGYMSYENGTLTIGAEANETKAQLTNTKFAFVGNGAELAYMGQNPDTDAWETVIDNARISDMLFFGNFAWIKRSNGNMSLKWVG